MTKRRSSLRRSFILSLTSLIICVAMLLGTTFAWFSETITSGKNTIKSGNLDIELEYYKDGGWSKVSGATDIFDPEALWEPGYTEVAYLKITNVGSLAIKYNLGINIVKEVAGTNVDGDRFNLSNYIMFGVKEVDAAGELNSRDAAVNAVKEGAKKLAEQYTENGVMEDQNETKILAVVLYMPTTVGNEANYMTGTTPPEIELGVNLVATQQVSEEDSFDENYDAGSPWLGDSDTSWYFDDPDATEFTLTTTEDLAGLAALVNGIATKPTSGVTLSSSTTVKQDFKGKTVYLSGDIDLGNMAWTPIGTSANRFKGTFDGQGYTVSNLYVDMGEGSYAGLFGYADANATIKNVNVHNVNVSAYSYVGGIVGRVYTGNVANCHVTGKVKLVSDYAYAGGIVGGDYVGITDCSVIADGMGEITINEKTGAGGICGWHTEGSYLMSNCHVKNLNITAWANLGGITGFVHYGNTIDGCSVENINLQKNRVDGNPSIGMLAGGWSYNATKPITITNNTAKNVTFAGNYVAIASADRLYGSEYSGKLTSNFVLDNNTTENITDNMIEVFKVTNSAELAAAISAGNSPIALSAGEYVLGDIGKTVNVELYGTPGAVITDVSVNRISVNKVVFSGLTFRTDLPVLFYGDSTITGCTFENGGENNNAIAWCYANNGATVTIENCEFVNDRTAGDGRAIHFDGSKGGTVNVKECTFDNNCYVAFEAALTVKFENCDFKYGLVSAWGDMTLTNCAFGSDSKVKINSNDKTIVMNGCTAKDGSPILSVCGVGKNVKGAFVIDGEEYVFVSGSESLGAAILAGGNVVLGSDIAVSDDILISNAAFMLDGQGHTVTVTDDAKIDYALIDVQGGECEIRNVIFDGVKGGAVIRTAGAKALIEGVTAKNGQHTQQQGLFRLLGESTVSGCSFINNTANFVVTFNFDTDSNDAPQVLKNCVFEKNACGGAAIAYYVCGASFTADGNEFVENVINTTANGATLYLGFKKNCTVTNNLFKNNKMITTGTSVRVSGGLMVGNNAVIKGNAFIGNVVEAGGRALGNDVCASVYYSSIDLSGNYWGGGAPVEGDDYFIEYPDSNEVIINDYLAVWNK